MKKTFILFFVLALIIAGAFYYFENFHKEKIDSWQLVPSSAIIAYENKSLVENWNKIVEKSVWKTFKKMPYFASWEKGLAEADSLSGKNGSIDRLFRNKPFIISAHIIASNEFDFLFNLNLGDANGETLFQDVIRSIQKKHSIITKSRTYQGQELHELIDKGSQDKFTYFIYKHVIVGSFTPFLVEDVVRNVSDEFKDTFKSQIGSLNGISKLENDEGNIYIDFTKLPDFFASFLSGEQATEIKKITRFSGDTFMDIKVTENELLLNGVSTIDLNSNKSFIGTFRNQNPGRIHLTDLMPNNTALLYHIAFSDFREWQNQMTKYWSATNQEQFQQAMDFEEKYGLNLDWVQREVANVILETPNKEQPDQLIFIGISNQDSVFNELSSFAEKLSKEQADSVYLEVYNELPIVQLPFKEFPSMFLGNYFKGFENSFITIYDDYLVVGNSMKAVKFFLNSLEDEYVWGKSVRQNMFLENTLSESSFSLMINTAACWPMITSKLNEKWMDLFKKYEQQLKSFDMMALQVSNLDKRFYTSLAIGHQKKVVTTKKTGRLKKKQTVYAMSPIVTKPFIVRNHNNNKFEALIQDSLNILYQISNEGEILWGDSIQDRIVSEIHQIDYYKNSKLQYLFATKDKIHLLDRNGDYVENYPIKAKAGVEFQHLSVIDYDNSKRYRIMAVDVRGNIYLYDKEGKNLEGWTPRALEGPLAVPGFHVRVKGGDCMIALQKNGILNVMNRRGKMYPGFPIDLNVAETNDLFVDVGNDFNSTRLITVSDEGEVIEVNLKGKILKREQLYKPGRESKFWLVNDALEKTFVVVRQEYSKLSVLNRTGDVIFESNISSSRDMIVQYYNFSSDNQVFVALDTEQEFVYVFDNSGRAISFEPLESAKPIGLLYSSRNKEFLLYKSYRNNFTVEIFK